MNSLKEKLDFIFEGDSASYTGQSSNIIITESMDQLEILKQATSSNGKSVVSCHSFAAKSVLLGHQRLINNSEKFIDNPEIFFNQVNLTKLFCKEFTENQSAHTMIELLEKIEKSPKLDRRSESLMSIAQELNTNAFKASKDIAITAKLDVWQNDEFVGIFFSDNAGRLKTLEVLENIEKQIKKRASDQLDASRSGLGLYLVLQYATTLILTCKPSSKTVIGALIPMSIKPALCDLYAKSVISLMFDP